MVLAGAEPLRMVIHHWPWVRALLHSVCNQPDAVSVRAEFDRALDALADKLPRWPRTSRPPAPTS